MITKYWEKVQNREKVKQYVETKDSNDLSVLDYCKIRGRHDIYSTVKCFCSDGMDAASAVVESKITSLAYELKEDHKEGSTKQRTTLDELTRINLRLETQAGVANAFALPDFQYPMIDLKLNMNLKENFFAAIPRHDQTECVWVDNEEQLAMMATTILKNDKVIAVDTEYHEFEPVPFD